MMKHYVRVTTLCQILLAIIFLVPAGAAQTCKTSIVATKPPSSFIIGSNGTVTDSTTGLMWMRCSLGQEWNQNTCSGTPTITSWADSLKAATSHEFAGYTDWRLPNKNELESILEGSCSSPSINTVIFPATPAAYFWSSSPYAAMTKGAWSVDFGYGTVNATVKSGSIYVRFVRDRE
jgi:hypothetical protein